MADFFRSALGYIGNVAGTSDNEFVGQNVELGQQKYRVKRLIGEGGRFDVLCFHLISGRIWESLY